MSNTELRATEVLSDYQPDPVFDVLAHEYRRTALSCLAEHDERIPLDALAEYVGNDVAPAGDIQNGELIERIVVQLYHVHLPKLEERGFVEYDGDRPYMVSVTPAGRTLESHLAEESVFESEGVR